MKKRIALFLFFLSLVMCACSAHGSVSSDVSTVFEPEISSKGSDLDSFVFNNRIAGIQCDFAESDLAYYYCPMGGQFLYYYDKQNGDYAPLCSKPDCLHNTDACMAYVGRLFNNSLCCSEGKLFWMSVSKYMDKPNVALWSMNEDGSGRTILLDLTEQLYMKEYNIIFSAIHQGKAFLFSDAQTLENEKPIDKLSVLVLDLNTKEIKTIFQNKYPNTVFANYFIRQEYLYFLLPIVGEQRHPVNELYSWNMETGELICLMKDNESGKTFREFWVDPEGTYYFSYWNSETDDGGQLSRVYLLSGEKAILLPEMDINGYEGYSLSDGIAVAVVSQIEGIKTALKKCCIKKLNGDTVYEGEVPVPEEIKNASTVYGGNMIWGNEKELVFEFRAIKENERFLHQYLVRYQIEQGSLKATFLMEHEPAG